MSNPFLYLISITWRYAGKKRRKMIVTYLFFVISNSIDMLQPLVLGLTLNTIQQGGQNLLCNVLVLLAVYYSTPFFFWIFHGIGRIFDKQLSFEVLKNFQEHMYRTVSELPLDWHKNHHSGNTINRIKKASDALADFTDETFIDIQIIMQLVVALIAICIISALLGLGAILACIVIIAIILRFDRTLIMHLGEVNEREHRIASSLHDYITNIITVITLRIQKLTRSELGQRIMAKYPPYRKLMIVGEVKWFTISMLLAFMSFFIMAAYIWREIASGGTILIGTVTILYQYVNRMNFAFFDFAWQYEQIVKRNTNIKAVDPLLAAHTFVDINIDPKPIAKWNKIEVRHLNFTHASEDEEREHLVDVHIDLAKGRKIALVGESGSGKSSLMVLLRGLLDTDGVDIIVDGRSVESFRSLANLSTLIPQDPEIFDNTIEYNITAGIGHHDEDVKVAACLACFDKVVERLPQGYQSHINEKGVNLSGGEKQRLALARGIFAAHDSSLILLDEPTSSVDPVNEAQIYRNLFKHFAGKCIVSSIHKLHLLSMFDWIYVMSAGQMIEEGTLGELLKAKGLLSKMWDEYEMNGK